MIEGKESLFFLHIVTHLLGSGTNSSSSPLTRHCVCVGGGGQSFYTHHVSDDPLMQEGVLEATETLSLWPPKQPEKA